MGNDDFVDTVMAGRGRAEYLDKVELWETYDDFVRDLAQRESAGHVAELGGGANPLIGDADRWGFVRHPVVIDISADELAKATHAVDTRVADLCQPITDGLNKYDLVFSKMLCEHVPDARAFHQNCFNLLRPGGVAVHFFPTLGTFPFLVNKLIPEKAARSFVDSVQPGRLQLGNMDKFPAYYRWTTGPTKRAFRRFESVGFRVEQYRASFGHLYYYVIPPLHALEEAKSRLLLRHPVPALTSFAAVVLRKPA
jgi:SAM-dependent methyltransferase